MVEDSSGQPQGGAYLLLEDASSGFTRGLTSARSGGFEFTLLPPGEYSLRVEQFGTRPLVVEGIRVGAGQPMELPVMLTRVSGPVEQVDTIRFAAGLLNRAAGMVLGLPREQLSLVPTERREAPEWARRSSFATSELEMEGLPAAYSRLWVDGAPVSAHASSILSSTQLLGAAFPLSALSGAELIGSLADVEYTGVTGGVLNLQSRRGGRETQLEAFGSFSNDALRTGVSGYSGDPYRSIQGGFRASGSLVPDTASFVIGAEAWRLGAPGGKLAGDALDEAALEIARSRYGVEFERPELRVEESEVISAFGRFDWLLSESSALQVRSNFADLSHSPGILLSPEGLVAGPGLSGRELFSSAVLTTRYSDTVQQEIRIGFDSSQRSALPDPAGIPGRTRIFGSSLGLGSDPLALRESREQGIQASGAFFVQSGTHRWKLGLSAGLDRFEQSFAPVRTFSFSGLSEFAAGAGHLLENRRTPAPTSFSLPRAGFFVQDSWAAALGMQVLFGVRFDLEGMPGGKVPLHAEWLRASGLASNEVERVQGRISPRVGIVWDLQERGEWIVRTSAGVYSGTIDPGIVGEWIAEASGSSVRREFGTFSSWPAPASTLPGPELTALTLLPQGYASPRSLRAELGISRLLGARTTLSGFVRVRDTELLPRYTDLNLWTDRRQSDQYGRLLMGTPVLRDGVLAMQGGGHRRFEGFDRISAVNLDGRSTYFDLNLVAEHRSESGVGFFASYTGSRTEDNGIATGSVLDPSQYAPIVQAGTEWREGRSDLDRPHRATLGIDMQLPSWPGLRMGAFYRVSSGLPFTPGFREGVDANGDGFAGNDPAFIDPQLPGMQALLDRWPCLRSQAGSFAARNSCRGEAMHSLDAHLGLGFARSGGAAFELFLDGLNLLGSRSSIPDRSLLLIDPSGSIAVAGDRVHLPLQVNERFGESRRTLEAGRVLRLGVRIDY